MTTIYEIVLIVCLVRKQLFEYVVSVGKQAAEDRDCRRFCRYKLRGRWVVSPVIVATDHGWRI